MTHYFHINLPDEVIQLHNIYKLHQKTLFLVGGAVRDSLLNLKPNDWDLVTDALPEESKTILKDFKISEEGIKFGVLSVHIDKEQYEIASYRKDVNNKVILGVTILEDCRRRDLTINALYYDIGNKSIIDIVDGLKDIDNKLIRMIGDCKQRFQEDKFRILRIIRISSRLEFRIDDEIVNYIKMDNKLTNVSSERILEEFLNNCCNINYLKLLSEFNFWNQMFPKIEINFDFVSSENVVIVLSNLFGSEINKLKLSKSIKKQVMFLINFDKLNVTNVYEMYQNKIRCGINDDLVNEWIKLKILNDDVFKKFLNYKPSFKILNFNLSGKELGYAIRNFETESFYNMKN